MKPAILVFLFASTVCADDGMWLFNQFPTDTVKEKHEFEAKPAFVDHLRLSTVQLSGGSGGFVSPHGLILTNWHIVAACNPKNEAGDAFLAATNAEEVKCPGMEARVLVSMEDITKRVKSVVKDDAKPEDALAARNAEIAKVESECSAKSGGKVCTVVNLHAGGEYQLYQYRRYNDLRLVFAPEQQLAFFGRERDSITYLRYGLDAAFIRAYENDKPAATPDYLQWSGDPVKDGDFVLASGSPATTARSTTVAQLNFYRDNQLPVTVGRLGARIKPLTKFSAASDENKKLVEPILKAILADYKSAIGKYIGLKDQRMQIRKASFEQKVRNAVERDPKLGTEGGKVWDNVATAYKTWANSERSYQILAAAPDPGSTLFRIARALVENQPLGADATAPVNEGLEITLLTMYLDEVRTLSEKHVPLKSIFGNKSSEQMAQSFVKSSKLADPAVRARYATDHASVAKADDGMLKLARLLEDPTEYYRKKRAELIGSLEVTSAEKIAGYRMQLFGAADYPDGTGTPRVSFGVLKGYTDRAGIAAPFAATFSGLFYRRNNEGPHMVPQNWVDQQSSLNIVTALDFVSTCDIGGADYGAPTVNKDGELVGIIFDGNLESLPATYLYTEDQARAVHVAVAGIAESLQKVYKAAKLLQELAIKPPKPAAPAASE
jgi:hypothetical protein